MRTKGDTAARSWRWRVVVRVALVVAAYALLCYVSTEYPSRGLSSSAGEAWRGHGEGRELQEAVDEASATEEEAVEEVEDTEAADDEEAADDGEESGSGEDGEGGVVENEELVEGWTLVTDASQLAKFEMDKSEVEDKEAEESSDTDSQGSSDEAAAAERSSAGGADTEHKSDKDESDAAAEDDSIPDIMRRLQEDPVPVAEEGAGEIEEKSTEEGKPKKDEAMASKLALEPLDSAVYGFVANRRHGFVNITHGFVGGDNDSMVLEASKFTKNEELGILFGDETTVSVVSHATRKFWSYDPAKQAITWGSQDKALKLEIYTNPSEDAVIFRTPAGQFVSFRSLPSDSRNSDKNVASSLTLVNTITENAVFSAPSVGKAGSEKAIMAYITNSRRKALKSGQTPSSSFLAFDLAHAVLLDMNFNKFMIKNCTKIDLNLIVHTMARVMVAYIPDYAEQYRSFGAELPDLVDLNTFALANRIDKSVGQAVTTEIMLSAESSSSFKDKQSSKAASFAALIIQQAVMRDLEANTDIFAADGSTRFKIIAMCYLYSCELANRIEGLSLMDKLNYTEFLYPDGSFEPYLERDGDGKFWFSSMVKDKIDNFKEANILRELGLFRYLPAPFLEKNTTVGEAIATVIIDDVAKMMQENNVKGLAEYAQHENLIAAAATAASFCNATAQAKFCIIPKVHAQISVLGQADGSLFTSSETTSLIASAGVDLKAKLQRLYEKKTNDDMIEQLRKKRNELMEFLKTSADKAAKDIKDDTLKTMLITAQQQAESQRSLADHLVTTSTFDKNAQFEQYKKKMQMMQAGIKTADDHKDSLMQELKDLAKRAKVEAAIDATLDAISTAVSALQVVNPVTGFNPAGIGEVVASANDLSKSVSAAVSTGKLAGRISKEMVVQVADIIKRMVDYRDEVGKVNAALTPMMSSDEIDEKKLSEHASSFLAVYSNFKSPVTPAEVEKIRAFFGEVVESLCAVIKIDGYNACVTVPGLVVKVFGSLGESIDLAQEAIGILFEVATAAVNTKNAEGMKADAEKQLVNTKVSQQKLSKKWDDKDEEKEKWWADWRKKQSYSNGVAAVGLSMNQAQLLNTVVQFCNNDAYLAGGTPNDICATTIFKGNPIKDDGIAQLIASERATKADTFSWQPLIPTRPMDGHEEGFLDLPRLMNGESVQFRVPTNAKWLSKLGWAIGEHPLESTVFYVRSFEIFLPPRYDNYMQRENTVKLTVQSTGVSSYGLALGGKTVAIPDDDSVFVTQYETQPAANKRTCDQVVLAGLSSCNPTMPKVCRLSKALEPDAELDPKRIMPSLFSPFQVSAVFGPQPQGANLVQYHNVTSPLYLRANVQVAVFSDVKWESKRSTKSSGGEADGPGDDAGSEEDAAEEDTGSSAKDEDEAEVSPSSSSADDEDAADEEVPELLTRRALQAAGEDSTEGSGAGSTGRCCPVGHYMDLLKKDCVPCPAGSVSQLGGTYCVAARRRMRW